MNSHCCFLSTARVIPTGIISKLQNIETFHSSQIPLKAIENISFLAYLRKKIPHVWRRFFYLSLLMSVGFEAKEYIFI